MRLGLLFCSVAILLLISHLRGDDGATVKLPASVRSAEQAFQRARDKSQSDLEAKEKPLLREKNAKIAAAKKAYLQAIDAAVKEALHTNDLAHANQLNAVKQSVVDSNEGEESGTTASDSNSRVYLCNLEHFEPQVFGGCFGKFGAFRNDAKILVDGKYSPNGMGLFPPARGYSKVLFNLDGKYSKFISGTAINDSSNGYAAGRIAFEVLGDGKSLWKGTPVEKWKTLSECSVNVRGVKILELRVNCPGDNGNDAAVWIEPQLLR